MSANGWPCRACYYLASHPNELDVNGMCPPCAGKAARQGTLDELVRDAWNRVDPSKRALVVTAGKILLEELRRRRRRSR